MTRAKAEKLYHRMMFHMHNLENAVIAANRAGMFEPGKTYDGSPMDCCEVLKKTIDRETGKKLAEVIQFDIKCAISEA